MVEPRDPGPGRQHDTDDIVSAAFASYRSAAGDYFTPLPGNALLTRAEAANARRPRKRLLAAGVSVLAFTGLMAAGVAFAQTVVAPQSDDTIADGVNTSLDSPSGDGGNQSGGPGGDEPSSDGSSSPVEQELQSLTIALPDWPGELGGDCPAGEYVFTPDEGSDDPTSDTPAGEDPGDWRLLPDDSDAVSTKLTESDDAVITPVACGDVPGVVALSKKDDVFNAVGFVYAAHKPDGAVTVDNVDGPNVTLHFEGVREQSESSREYTFDGGKFVEVDPGDKPTDEPPSPTDDPQTLPSEDDDPSSGEPDPGEDESTSEQPHEDDSDGSQS